MDICFINENFNVHVELSGIMGKYIFCNRDSIKNKLNQFCNNKILKIVTNGI